MGCAKGFFCLLSFGGKIANNYLGVLKTKNEKAAFCGTQIRGI